jgi:hypothetical protein
MSGVLVIRFRFRDAELVWVEYAAYCAELFGLQMAYGLATLSVL